MAPRKRQTKKSKKPELDGLCKELLEDLRLCIEDKLCLMDEKEKEAIASIESIFHSAEMKLPKNLREMTIDEYKKSEQSDLYKLMPQLTKQGCEQTSSIGRSYRSIGHLTQKLSLTKKAGSSTAKRVGAKQTAVTVSPKKMMRTRKGTTSVPATVKRSRESDKNNEVFVSLPRLRKRASQTNKNNKQTITPKFDLRKPVVANRCRAPHPGEVLVSVSGSPLQNPGGECLVSVGGQVLNMEELTSATEFDEKMKLQLQEIRKKLNRIVF